MAASAVAPFFVLAPSFECGNTNAAQPSAEPENDVIVTTSKSEIQLPARPVGALQIITGLESVVVRGALDGSLTLDPETTAKFEWSTERGGWTLRVRYTVSQVDDNDQWVITSEGCVIGPQFPTKNSAETYAAAIFA